VGGAERPSRSNAGPSSGIENRPSKEMNAGLADPKMRAKLA